VSIQSQIDNEISFHIQMESLLTSKKYLSEIQNIKNDKIDYDILKRILSKSK
jgi:hypothetical protein